MIAGNYCLRCAAGSLWLRAVLVMASLLSLAACNHLSEQPEQRTSFHLQQDISTAQTVSPPVAPDPADNGPTVPQSSAKYDIAVKNVPVQELLHALARDSRINIDIHPAIDGHVTLNATAQTLAQILTRIARQVAMRWEIDDGCFVIMPDTPFVRHYRVDYVNTSRDMIGTIAVSSQMNSAAGDAGMSRGSGDGNHSLTRIESRAANRFWSSLVENIKSIVSETENPVKTGASKVMEVNATVLQENPSEKTIEEDDKKEKTKNIKKLLPARSESSSSQAAVTVPSNLANSTDVVAHPESGIISVRATSRQHDKIKKLIDEIVGSVQRQVMIEATIVEVQLNHSFEQGVDWSRISLDGTGFSLTQSAAGNISAPPSSLIQIGYNDPRSVLGNITAAVKLLESFGVVKVLSTPKISVMNNQTAVLKVVDNQVYFTLSSDVSQNQNTTLTTFTSNLHSIPVGFVLSVTAQISGDDNVLVIIRPSVSRIIGYVSDPNPALKTADVVSEIPVIRSREMESMMNVRNGNIMIMGGLMEDAIANRDNKVPLIGHIPLLGELFTHRNDSNTKSELLVLLRPTVINNDTAGHDMSASLLKGSLPGKDFLKTPAVPGRSPLHKEGAVP